MGYTERQRELIRARLLAYYDLRRARSRKISWGAICDEIFDETGVQIAIEDVRQFVKRFVQKDRNRSRGPNDEELEAIVSFLKRPRINLLSDKELNEPEIPYRFAEFLLDFLAHPEHNQQFPPKALGGRYLALLKSSDGSIHKRVELTLRVHKEDHVIRVTESSEAWSSVIDGDLNNDERSPAKPELDATYRAKGWAVITPEDSLLIFLKNERYGHNHYYLTIALYPGIWSETSVCQLALLRHQYPVPDDSASKSLEALMQDTEGDTVLLHFTKSTETDPGR